MSAIGDTKKETMMDLFKDRTLTLRLAILWWIWVVVLLAYYGLTLASVNFSGDPYLNFFLASLIEIPGSNG